MYLGEAPDIKQKVTSDRLISPCGDIESIMRATTKKTVCFGLCGTISM
jgi:hypothetical protein